MLLKLENYGHSSAERSIINRKMEKEMQNTRDNSRVSTFLKYEINETVNMWRHKKRL